MIHCCTELAHTEFKENESLSCNRKNLNTVLIYFLERFILKYLKKLYLQRKIYLHFVQKCKTSEVCERRM